MAKLHLSKVAVGCASLDELHRRQQSRICDGHVPVMTRFRPKRAEELVGGSLYWIVRHRLVARQEILGFAEHEAERRTVIRLEPDLVPVRAIFRRAHQGWRYLDADDAPRDLEGEWDEGDRLPPLLAERLAVLALI